MTIEETLLEAIRRDSGDELAWLALADHLEESGQGDRAELSRLTRRLCALRPDDAARREWEPRLGELLRAGVRPCLPTAVNSLGMRFVLVPPGTGLMGAEVDDEQGDDTPRHEIGYAAPFWLAERPVSQAEYERVMGVNPSSFSPPGRNGAAVRGLDTSRFPVDSVSWEDAVAFCEQLSRMEPGRLYRLPTEAEWEYACRAGGAVAGTFLLGESLASDVANFDGQQPYGGAPAGPVLGRTSEPGAYPPNPLGLLDMLGNVWEWVDDWFAPGYEPWPRLAPRGPETGTSKVLRGGSWSSYGWGCRIAYRNCIGPSAANPNFGFRVLMESQR